MDAATLWGEIVQDVRQGVTGVGVWTAINASKPVALEDGTFVLGIPEGMSELGGHLKVPSTKRLIETLATAKTGTPTILRIIDGADISNWESVKRKDIEARRMQEASLKKMRDEIESRTSWDSVYEQLSRRYAAVTTKSLPQNRARFFEEGAELIAEARKSMVNWDDLAERNFARCIERLAQYSELPSALCALEVLRRAGEV